MSFPKLAIALSALLLSPLATSTPTPLSRSEAAYPDFVHPSNGDCKDYLINSTVTFSELEFSQPHYKNNFELSALLAKIAIQGKVPFNAFSGSHNETKTFQIGGTFCKPKVSSGAKQNKVLVATHGIGFDRRYWASSFQPSTYSFAQSTLAAGNSIFYYDRLGVGLSSRVPGFEIEVSSQIEILGSLLKSLRAGEYTNGIKPSKLVLIGHSYGSTVSSKVVGRYPKLADAVILTGYSFPQKPDPAYYTGGFGLSIFASRIISTLPASAKPQFSSSFDDAWISFGDKYAFTESFLGGEDYDVAAAEYAFTIAQPYSAVDFVSAFADQTMAPGFEGKVLLAPAERDLFFCAGDCRDTFKQGTQSEFFSNPKVDVKMYVQEGSGHGQNFAKNAGDLYKEVVKFVETV